MWKFRRIRHGHKRKICRFGRPIKGLTARRKLLKILSEHNPLLLLCRARDPSFFFAHDPSFFFAHDSSFFIAIDRFFIARDPSFLSLAIGAFNCLQSEFFLYFAYVRSLLSFVSFRALLELEISYCYAPFSALFIHFIVLLCLLLLARFSLFFKRFCSRFFACFLLGILNIKHKKYERESRLCAK